MKESEVAYKVLNRRNGMSPVVMIGELQEVLGQEGYELAMARGWVVPNWDSGELSVTDMQEKLNDMQKLAADFKGIAESKTPINNIYQRFTSFAPGMQIVESFGTPAPSEYGIGDEVVVADDGQPMKAIVKAKNPDGTYQLSFGNLKPRAARPSYKKDEMKKTAAGPEAAKPGVPAGAPPAVVR